MNPTPASDEQRPRPVDSAVDDAVPDAVDDGVDDAVGEPADGATGTARTPATPRGTAATPRGTVPPQPAAPRPAGRHGRGGWRSLVISMLILLGIVALWIALLPRPAGTARPAVDVGSSARYAAAGSGTTLFVPTLPAPWRPTSVRTTDTASVRGWHAGYTHDGDDRAYVAVEETAATGTGSDAAWTRGIVKAATERETRIVDGRPWALYSDGGDPERRSLVGRIDGTLVVVTGLADLDVLLAAAQSLRAVPPDAAASTSSSPTGAASAPSAAANSSSTP